MPMLDTLFNAARLAQANAYAPYSKFMVGAALRDEAGEIFSGCNVENAAYPSGNCAEAGAISAMIAAGGRRITALLVVADGADAVTPCGNCRQKILEFSDEHTLIHCANDKGVQLTLGMGDLMPHSFGAHALAKIRTPKTSMPKS